MKYTRLKPTLLQVRQWTQRGLVLDVRRPEEYALEALVGSVLLPLHDLLEKADQVLLDKDQEIFVYCAQGLRSKVASYLLLSMGYKYVYDIGGLDQWKT